MREMNAVTAAIETASEIAVLPVPVSDAISWGPFTIGC